MAICFSLRTNCNHSLGSAARAFLTFKGKAIRRARITQNQRSWIAYHSHASIITFLVSHLFTKYNVLMKIISTNKKAYYRYTILEKYEAGIALTGAEIKSIRLGRVDLTDSFVKIKNSEAFLINCFIALYQKTSPLKYEPRKTRKLLLKKHEIESLKGKLTRKNLTIIPLRVYIKRNLAKIELGLARSKKKYERKEEKKRQSIEREIQQALKEAEKERVTK